MVYKHPKAVGQRLQNNCLFVFCFMPVKKLTQVVKLLSICFLFNASKETVVVFMHTCPHRSMHYVLSGVQTP
jgi:hypothetical protein